MLLGISIIYVAVSYMLGLGSEWYTASINFFIGVLMVFYKNNIDQFVLRRYKYYAMLFSCLFIAFIGGDFYFHNNYFLKVMFCYFSSAFFIFIIILILYKFKLFNKPVGHIGVISYELYLTHMKVYNLMITYSNNVVLYILLTFSASFSFYKLYNYIIEKFSKHTNKSLKLNVK